MALGRLVFFVESDTPYYIYKYRYNRLFVKILKNNVKNFPKCLEIKNKALPLHPQSDQNAGLRATAKVLATF